MIGLLASIRPDSWNFPLLLHVLGATLLVGAVTAAVGTLLLTPGGGGDPAGLRRFAFRVLLFVGLPAYVVMRIGAEWIRDKEYGDLPKGVDEPGWVGIGYITADLGLLVLLITVVCAWLAHRNSSERLGKIAGILGAVLLVAWVVAVWAMGAKPS
jgi:hypothetical protein